MIFALIILYVVSLVYLSIAERYKNYVSLLAIQGWILFFIAMLRLHTINIFDLTFVLTETLIFKAFVVPYVLRRIIHRTKINRVLYVGANQFGSLVASLVALIVSVVVTYYIADNTINMIFFGVAIYALLSGLIMITTRKRIFSHLVGFLVIENGVFLFSMAFGVEMPFLINIAILIDILISILMLSMFVSKFGDSMQNIDSDHLTSLKD